MEVYDIMSPILKNILITTIFCLICILLITGIVYITLQKSELKYYPIPENFICISYYTAEKDEFLGRKGEQDIDILGGVYTLKDLPKEKFILHEQSYLNIVNGPPDVYVYMDNDNAEPIFIYDVNKIEFNLNKNKITIKNKQIINEVLSILRNGTSEKCEEPSYINTFFKFNLKCYLTFLCCVEYLNDKIYITCFNVKDNCWYTYDVTLVLKDYLNQ